MRGPSPDKKYLGRDQIGDLGNFNITNGAEIIDDRILTVCLPGGLDQKYFLRRNQKELMMADQMLMRRMQSTSGSVPIMTAECWMVEEVFIYGRELTRTQNKIFALYKL